MTAGWNISGSTRSITAEASGGRCSSGRAEPAGDLRLYVFAHNVRAIAFYKAHGAVQIAASEGHGNEEKMPDLTLLIPGA